MRKQRVDVKMKYYSQDSSDEIKALAERIDYLEKKMRSKLDYLLKEIQKLRDIKN